MAFGVEALVLVKFEKGKREVELKTFKMAGDEDGDKELKGSGGLEETWIVCTSRISWSGDWVRVDLGIGMKDKELFWLLPSIEVKSFNGGEDEVEIGFPFPDGLDDENWIKPIRLVINS